MSRLAMVCWSFQVRLLDITSPFVDSSPIWTAPMMRWDARSGCLSRNEFLYWLVSYVVIWQIL
jgi:hypothetical protein